MKRFLAPLLLSVPLLASTPAFALQLVEARDGVTVDASLSLREPTRIRIEGAPITDVFGNIYSSNCGQAAGTPQSGQAVNPSGEVVLECDRDKGEVYVRPVGSTTKPVNLFVSSARATYKCDRDKGEVYVRPVGSTTKPVNLFVSSARATYTLLLRRSDTPADTIVLRDKTPRKMTAAEAASQSIRLQGQAPNHVRSLKAMLIAMASDRVSPDIRIEDANRPVQLWAEARFSLMRIYEGRGLIGEKYQLTNVSAKPIVVAEQEFDREDGNVRAVAIENHNLRPGESTSVYVIRSGS